MKRPQSTIKTSLWYDDIYNYQVPTDNQIVTAKPYLYFNTLLSRQLPLLLKKNNILFYSYIQIYIPLYLFFKHDSTKKFYNAFIEFMQKEFKNALLSGYNTYGRTILTTSDFYWFGWFDVYKKNLAIFILLNQPIETSDAKHMMCSWLSKYFSYTLRSTREILVSMLPTSDCYSWVNSSLWDLAEIQNNYWARRFFLLEIFKGSMNQLFDYFFYLQANMITKYCLFFSLFDAYARHSLQDFENVEQLFDFYHKAGITKKTFTNIPGMVEDFFFTNSSDFRPLNQTYHHVYEYNIWLVRNKKKGNSNTRNVEIPLFVAWYHQKEFYLSVEDHSLQRLFWNIHTLNFIGDYYHLCFNYRKMHSKQQVMELRAPDLDFPIKLPNYGYDLEDFLNVQLANGEEDPAFDSSIPDHYQQIQEYKKQHEKEVNEMKKKNYLPQIDGTFDKYPEAFNAFREQMEDKTERFLEEYISNRTSLPSIFIERCQKGGYYLPFKEWWNYRERTGQY